MFKIVDNKWGDTRAWDGFKMGVGDVKGKVFTLKSRYSSCRAWIGDALPPLRDYTVKFKSSFPLDPTYNWTKGKTYILVWASKDEYENTLKNLNWLHEMERTAKVGLTKIYKTDKKNNYLFEGSSHWKNTAWKIMFYTYLLKCTLREDPNSGEYHRPYVVRNIPQLLSKAKCKVEVYDSSVFGEFKSSSFHDREGFVSICAGYNKPMAELLGVVPRTKEEGAF